LFDPHARQFLLYDPISTPATRHTVPNNVRQFVNKMARFFLAPTPIVTVPVLQPQLPQPSRDAVDESAVVVHDVAAIAAASKINSDPGERHSQSSQPQESDEAEKKDEEQGGISSSSVSGAVVTVPDPVVRRVSGLPSQTVSGDCGVYVVEYAQAILEALQTNVRARPSVDFNFSAITYDFIRSQRRDWFGLIKSFYEKEKTKRQEQREQQQLQQTHKTDPENEKSIAAAAVAIAEVKGDDATEDTSNANIDFNIKDSSIA